MFLNNLYRGGMNILFTFIILISKCIFCAFSLECQTKTSSFYHDSWIPNSEQSNSDTEWFCQPLQACWPNKSEIESFSSKINGSMKSCLGLKKFIHFGDDYSHEKVCLPYTGLNVDNLFSTKKPNSIDFFQKGCNSPNPLRGAHYNTEGLACMTPDQFLNMRNHKAEWLAAFIVTAHSKEDIRLALKFAKNHNLGVSVMNTGHDNQDRSAGPGRNALQIRTTCFRHWEPHIGTSVEDQHGVWNDGYVRVGAGLTLGTNFWTSLKNAKGIYELAADLNKEMVGANLPSVGIVGCTLGGCIWATSHRYGLGVDQLLNVELVFPNGTFTAANFTHNQDLFYALRGGGGGFGIIHSMTLKMHNASCQDSQTGLPTMENCYTHHFLNYTGKYSESQTPRYVKTLLKLYFSWSTETRSQGWNSILSFFYFKDRNEYTVQIVATHFGLNGSSSLFHQFINQTKDLQNKKNEKSNYYFFHSFKDNNNEQVANPNQCRLEKRILDGIGINFNSSITTNGFLDSLLELWQPHCDKFPYSACADGFQFYGDLPAINSSSGQGVHSSGGAISPGFRSASFNMINFGLKMDWIHYNLGPKLYKFSNSSYFNEPEYTLSPGQWQRRFWDPEQYKKLLKIKQEYDPNLYLACRHCVGWNKGE